MAGAVKRSRVWFFTGNNPKEEGDAFYASKLDANPVVEYAKFQREVGEEGTEHLQGVIKFTNQRTLSALRRNNPFDVGVKWHWEIPRSKRACLTYVCKESTRMEGHVPIEVGAVPQQGKRNDIKAGITLMQEKPNASWSDLGMENQAIPKYMTFFQKVKLEKQPKRKWKCEGSWLYGPTGGGKSYMAMDTPSRYKKPHNKWWDGYKGETRIVIDDFSGGISVTQLKLWCDEYECQVETKGGHVQLLAREVVITSNHPPWNVFTNVREADMMALYRRFKVYKVEDRTRAEEEPPQTGYVRNSVTSYSPPNYNLE